MLEIDSEKKYEKFAYECGIQCKYRTRNTRIYMSIMTFLDCLFIYVNNFMFDQK